MRSLQIITAGVASLALVACGDDKTEATSDADQAGEETVAEQKSQQEKKSEFEKFAATQLMASEKFLEENAEREGVEVTDSGLQYMVLEEGPEGAPTPVSTDKVVVHYVGTLRDGIEFDSSHARGLRRPSS